GAFTGAAVRHLGKFEQAHGGTLFLDEIGDMPAAMQAKLLRLLQVGELERIGGERPIVVDTRVVAATHRDLEGLVQEGVSGQDARPRRRRHSGPGRSRTASRYSSATWCCTNSPRTAIASPKLRGRWGWSGVTCTRNVSSWGLTSKRSGNSRSTIQGSAGRRQP